MLYTLKYHFLTISHYRSSIQQPTSPSPINSLNIFKSLSPSLSPSSSPSPPSPPPPTTTTTTTTHQTGEGRSQMREKRNAGKSEKVAFFSRKQKNEYGRRASEHKLANSHVRPSKPRFIQILVIHFLRAVTPTLIRRINICADGVFIPRVGEWGKTWWSIVNLFIQWYRFREKPGMHYLFLQQKRRNSLTLQT